MVTAASSHSSNEVEAYSKVLWALDYIPFISTGKQIVDLFFFYCWRPADLDQLPTFVYTYHQHLTNKDAFRYIAIIPVVGNLVLIISDVCQNLSEATSNLEQSDAVENNETDARHDPFVDSIYDRLRERLNEATQREREQLDQLRERLNEAEQFRAVEADEPEPIPQRIALRAEDFAGTVPYDRFDIPADIQAKADEIAILREKAEEDNIAIPQGFICLISHDVMSMPVFDYTHPSINAVNINNRDLRHLVDKTSLERAFASLQIVKCSLCRYPEDGRTERRNLLIDTALQDEILAYLRTNVV